METSIKRSTRRMIISLSVVSLLLSVTTSQADVVRTPIGTDQVGGLVSSCLRQGGGDHPNDHGLPVFCCATNSEGTRWCVTCFSGNEQNPQECVVTTPARVSAVERFRARLSQAGNLAPPSEHVEPASPRARFGVTLRRSASIVTPNN